MSTVPAEPSAAVWTAALGSAAPAAAFLSTSGGGAARGEGRFATPPDLVVDVDEQAVRDDVGAD